MTQIIADQLKSRSQEERPLLPFGQAVQQDDRSRVARVVRGNTEFALALCQELRESEGNLFFSPYSISTALAMTYAGAGGDTAAQMAQVLHFELAQERLHPAFALLDKELAAAQATGDIALHVANSLWPLVGYTFLPAYLKLCQRYYGVSITALDYCTDPDGARQVDGLAALEGDLTAENLGFWHRQPQPAVPVKEVYLT